MLVKICGLREIENIREIVRLHPDFVGFIFYPKSLRYAETLDSSTLASIPSNIKKVGVFVNEELENILTLIYNYKLDAVQLHGAENQELCKKIKKEANVMVIKAFAVMEAYNLKVTKDYEGIADLFLFDTKTDQYGGSGQKFNWNILHEYKGNTPFLLSGGIGMDDLKAIKQIEHPKMVGVDINSKFEIEPGLKNVELVKLFMEEINKPVEKPEENSENEQD